MEATPFNLVFNALWALVDASAPLSRLVKTKNKIRYNLDQNRDPIKLDIQTADTPELILASGGSSSGNLKSSTCSTSIVREYTFLLSTGDYRATEFLLPVEFALFCALADFQTHLMPLVWKGEHFVKNVNIVNLTEGMSNAELNRGINGWSGLWTCQVDMHFTTSKLKAHNSE